MEFFMKHHLRNPILIVNLLLLAPAASLYGGQVAFMKAETLSLASCVV